MTRHRANEFSIGTYPGPILIANTCSGSAQYDLLQTQVQDSSRCYKVFSCCLLAASELKAKGYHQSLRHLALVAYVVQCGHRHRRILPSIMRTGWRSIFWRDQATATPLFETQKGLIKLVRKPANIPCLAAEENHLPLLIIDDSTIF